MQEWSDALQDLQVILAFIPIHVPALLMRARIYACQRLWEKAKDDYELILYHQPKNIEAADGLKEIKQFDPTDALDVET